MKSEIWRVVDGYENYSVSNFGNVKNVKTGLKLNPSVNSVGYKVVNLSRGNQFKVHTLVAMVFLNHIPCGLDLVVDHIDNDKLNNNLDNLQVIKHRYNLKKDRKNDTSKHHGVSFYKSSKKWVARIFYNGKNVYLGSYDSEIDASIVVKRFLEKSLES